MKKYLRRFVKYLLYVVVVFTILFHIMPAISGDEPINLVKKLGDPQFQLILVFFMAFALIYPLIGFTKIQRHLNGTYLQNQGVFEKAFEMLNYIKTKDSQEQVVYRKKSNFARFMQMYEDEIEVKTGDNPVIISGMRKTVKRIDRVIDQLLAKESN